MIRSVLIRKIGRLRCASVDRADRSIAHDIHVQVVHTCKSVDRLVTCTIVGSCTGVHCTKASGRKEEESCLTTSIAKVKLHGDVV